MKNRYLIVVIVFIVLFLFFVILICRNNSDNIITVSSTTNIVTEIEVPTKNPTENEEQIEIRTGIETGEKIILAIDLFYEKYKDYPETLDALVPDFLSEIPITITGRHYSYYIWESEEYIVSFTRASRRDEFGCAYLKRLDFWDCGRIAD